MKKIYLFLKLVVIFFLFTFIGSLDLAKKPDSLPENLQVMLKKAHWSFQPLTMKLQYISCGYVLNNGINFTKTRVDKGGTIFHFKEIHDVGTGYLELNLTTREVLFKTPGGIKELISDSVEIGMGTVIMKFPTNYIITRPKTAFSGATNTKNLQINSGKHPRILTISYGHDCTMMKVSNTQLRFLNDSWSFYWDITLGTNSRVNRGTFGSLRFGDGPLIPVSVIAQY